MSRKVVSLTTTEQYSSHEFPQELLKSVHDFGKVNAHVISWSYDMAGHAKTCVERFRELADKKNRAFGKSLDTLYG